MNTLNLLSKESQAVQPYRYAYRFIPLLLIPLASELVVYKSVCKSGLRA